MCMLYIIISIIIIIIIIIILRTRYQIIAENSSSSNNYNNSYNNNNNNKKNKNSHSLRSTITDSLRKYTVLKEEFIRTLQLKTVHLITLVQPTTSIIPKKLHGSLNCLISAVLYIF